MQEAKFTKLEVVEFLLYAILGVVLFYIDINLLYVGLFTTLAGMFNGTADQINFDHKDNPRDDSVFPYILSGWIFRWFRGDFKQYVRDRWWIHAIFMDGWHFFKNMWVLILLLTITYSLYINISASPWLVWLASIIYAYMWMIGKTSMHGKIASASFWGYEYGSTK